MVTLILILAGTFSGAALAQNAPADAGDEPRATQQIQSDFLCKSRHTDQFRLVRSPSCASSEILIQISAELPFDYCVSRFSGILYDDRAGDQCAPGDRYVVEDGTTSFFVCYDRYTGRIYQAPANADCGSRTTVFFVDLRGDLTKFACVEENLHDALCDIFPAGGPQNEIRQLEPLINTAFGFQDCRFQYVFDGATSPATYSCADSDHMMPAGIQAALETVPTIGVGNVIVTALNPGEHWSTLFDIFNTPEDESTPIRVEFVGVFAGTDVVPPITIQNVQSTAGGAEETVIDGSANSPGLNNVLAGGTVQIFRTTGATDPNNPATYGPEVTAGPQPVDATGSYTESDLFEGDYVVCADGTNSVSASCEIVTINAASVLIVNNVDLPGTISAAITDTTGTNEVQTLQQCSFGCNVTGGTFTLTFDGQTTAGIPANATTVQVQTALEALSNVNAGDIVTSGQNFVLGNSGNTMTFTFGGQYAGADVPELVFDGTNLTGAGFALRFWDVQTVTEGSGEIHTLTADNRVSGGTFTLSFNNGMTTSTTTPLDFDASVTEIENALNALASISAGGGSVTVVSTDPNFISPQNTPITKAPVEVNFSGVANADVNVLIVDNTNLE